MAHLGPLLNLRNQNDVLWQFNGTSAGSSTPSASSASSASSTSSTSSSSGTSSTSSTSGTSSTCFATCYYIFLSFTTSKRLLGSCQQFLDYASEQVRVESEPRLRLA